MSAQKELTGKVEEWWNNNPFAFGYGNDKGDQVGTIELSKMDRSYFEEIERRFRKHSRGGAQDEGKPLFSNIIDYERQVTGKRVLDIATGSGFAAVAFAEGGAKSVTAIDLTQFAVDHATRNFAARNLQADIKKMDAQQMTFRDHSFDFVNAWGCLMHMPNTEGAITEIYRVLAPGGTTMAYMYNKSSWPYWFNIFLVRGILMLGLLRFGFDTVKLTSRYSDGYSLGGNMLTKFYRPIEAKHMFEAAGFREVSVKPFLLVHAVDQWPMRQLPLFRYLPTFLKRPLARYGYAFIVTARK